MLTWPVANWFQALADLGEAVAICKQLDDTLEVAVMQSTCISNLAEIYLAVGHYNQAQQLLLEAQAQFAARHGEEHEDMATIYNNLGAVCVLPLCHACTVHVASWHRCYCRCCCYRIPGY